MATKRARGSAFEAMLLVAVFAFPLLAILWYFFGQNISETPAPAAPAPAQQQTVVQTPTVVELSLDDASSLPTSVSTAQIVPFSFTIENPGASTATYQYKVSVDWNTGEQDIIDENTATVASGASTDIPESLKFETASDVAQITIEVEDPEQEITFTLPRS